MILKKISCLPTHYPTLIYWWMFLWSAVGNFWNHLHLKWRSHFLITKVSPLCLWSITTSRHLQLESFQRSVWVDTTSHKWHVRAMNSVKHCHYWLVHGIKWIIFQKGHTETPMRQNRSLTDREWKGCVFFFLFYIYLFFFNTFKW